MPRTVPDRPRTRLPRTVAAALLCCTVGGMALVADVAGLPGTSLPPAAAKDKDPAPPKPDAPAVDPRTLPDDEKAKRLTELKKAYDDLSRNQDLIPVRTRRAHVVFLGDMRYAPAGKFLRMVFEQDRDEATRVAALMAVGRSGDFPSIEDAVRKSISIAKDEPVYAASLPRMFSQIESVEAREWLHTRIPQKDGDVRASVVEAVGEARVPAALPTLLEVLASSQNVDVRFECLRAIGKTGQKAAVAHLLPYLKDPDWRMRMGAVEALGFAGSPDVIADLRALLVRTEEPVVVETALEAIAALGTKEAVEPLIEGLKMGRLRARQKVRAALRRMSGELFKVQKDYHLDVQAWTVWWNKIKRGVDPEDPAFNSSETTSYFRFPIQSDRILFILDVSGSMQWPNAPANSGIKPADWNGRRIDIAHAELFKALRALAKQNKGRALKKLKKGETSDLPYAPSEDGEEPPTLFNVATFAGVVTPWGPDVVVATEENVEAAIAWLEKQLPRGGTATYDALEHGLQHKNIDTVMFLSDGVPSLGKFEARETILAEVRKLNRFRRISINTVALIVGLSPIESVRKYEDPDDMAELMGRIASENQGTFSNESRN